MNLEEEIKGLKKIWGKIKTPTKILLTVVLAVNVVAALAMIDETVAELKGFILIFIEYYRKVKNFLLSPINIREDYKFVYDLFFFYMLIALTYIRGHYILQSKSTGKPAVLSLENFFSILLLLPFIWFVVLPALIFFVSSVYFDSKFAVQPVKTLSEEDRSILQYGVIHIGMGLLTFFGLTVLVTIDLVRDFYIELKTNKELRVYMLVFILSVMLITIVIAEFSTGLDK